MTAPNAPLRILFVEDLPSDVELAERELRKEGLQFTSLRVETREAFLEALEKFRPDLIISDYALPQFDGMQALRLAIEHAADLPFVVLTGSMNEDTAVACIKAGAADYVIKEHITRLPFVVREALEQKATRAGREEAERTLRLSEETFRQFFENQPEYCYMVSPDGVILNVNAAALEALGYSKAEMVGWPLTKVCAPETLARHQALLDKWRGTGSLRNEEIVVVGKNGVRRTVLLSVSTVTDENGNVRHAVCSQRDITERKQAQDALRESERRMAHLLSVSPAIIYSLDPHGHAPTWVSANVADILGYTVEETLRPDWWAAHLHPEDRERALAGSARVLSQDSVVHEYRFYRKDGREIWVRDELRLLRDERGYPAEIVGVWTDITERRQTEAERLLLESAIEHAAETIVVTDVEGTIQYVNPAFTTITGYTREEAVGRNPRMLSSGEHDQAFYRALWEIIAGGKTWKGRFVNKKKDGTLYTEDATISPVRDAGGAIVGYVAAKRDITNELSLEAQMRQAQKMESVGRLAGGVAHDFNNMLQVIASYVEVAMRKVDPSQPLHEYLQQVQKAAQRSAELTGQLLAFARRQAVSPSVLQLNDTVSGMLQMLRRLIGEDIDLAWLPGRELWNVRIDRSQVDQILANLAVNARDAIRGTGKVTVETRNVVFDAVYCAQHAGFVPGEYVMLAVSDDGSGMDKETLSHIFEPFFTTKDTGEGTGLGLATVYGIVKQNDGFINLYSEPGQGSTFRIYLPRFEGAAVVVPAGREAGEPQGGRETVLIAEDEDAILTLGRMILEQLGYTVLTATTPQEAIRLAEARPGAIDLLVTDVVLPQMNGRDLAERLRPVQPGMRCLYMSGYTANVIAHRGVLEEGVHFIAKPFSVRALADKVREALDG